MKCLCLFLLASALQGQDLGQIRARLQELDGKAPLRIQAERQSWKRDLKSDAPPSQGWVRAQMESGPEGSRVVPGTGTASPGGDPRPLGAREAAQVLEAAPQLLELLSEARLESLVPEVREGIPTRRARFALPLEDEALAKKHMKEAWRSLDLWVTEDGTPVASLEAFRIRGRVMLVKVEAEARIRREYRAVGGRLLLVLEDKEARGSGMGHGSEGRTLLTAAPR